MTDLTFTQRLILAQESIGTISRDRENPRFGSRYATLDALLAAVKPALHAQGLALTQLINATPTGDLVVTRITDGTEEVLAATPICSDRSLPQAFGSAVTYARRYALAALLAISTDDDDDANGAQAHGHYVIGTAQARPVQQPRSAAPAHQEVTPAAASPYTAPTEGHDRPHLRAGAVVVHFGKNNGTPVAALKPKQLDWYCDEWEPRYDERIGGVHPLDEALKLACDQYRRHLAQPGVLDRPGTLAAVQQDEADGIDF